MLPLLCPGDRLLVCQQFPLCLGDVVVFREPSSPQSNGTRSAHLREATLYVKRIVGLPHSTIAWGERRWRLGPDEYFLVGDNRAGSTDSRHIGPIRKANIIGRAVLKYYPQLAWLAPQQFMSGDRRL